MAKIDTSYHRILEEILSSGYYYNDPNRKGTKRLEIDDARIEYDLTKGFPAITTKDLYWKGVVGELIWFLRGDTNIKYLIDNNINIWNPDAYRHYFNIASEEESPTSLEEVIHIIKKNDYYKLPNFNKGEYVLGDLGPVYGHQWRNYDGKVDQIQDVIDKMKNNPMASNIVLTAWNPSDKEKMALEPCHYGFQIMMRPLTLDQRCDIYNVNKHILLENSNIKNVHKILDNYNVPKYGFTLKWRQRSVDTFLGLPFNIASYALLADILGKITNSVPLKLIGDLSKVHLYDNAIDQAKEQLSRDTEKYKDCQLSYDSKEGTSNIHSLRSIESIDAIFNNLYIEGFKLKNYNHYPKIKVEMLSYNK